MTEVLEAIKALDQKLSGRIDDFAKFERRLDLLIGEVRKLEGILLIARGRAR